MLTDAVFNPASLDRIRNSVGYIGETDTARDLVDDYGMSPEDAFLAITAAKLLDKWAQEPLPTPAEGE